MSTTRINKFNLIFLLSIAINLPLQAIWQPPEDVSLFNHNATSAQIAVDPNGNATVVWRNNTLDSPTNIQASTMPFGGSWQTVPDTISVPGQMAFDPQIAVDTHGNAIAIWSRSNGTNFIVQAASKPFGGNWQAVPDNLSLPGDDALNPDIAFDTHGNATAVWRRFINGLSTIQASSKLFGGGWQAVPDTISLPKQGAVTPHVKMDANGDAVAIWARFNGSNPVIQSSTKPFRGNWQAIPDNVSLPGHNAKDPHLALDPKGNATAVWTRENGVNLIVQASSKPLGGNWQAIPENLSAEGQDAAQAAIAVDLKGNATAVWSRFNGANSVIQSSTKPFKGQWQKNPESLSLDGQDASHAQIAVDTNGNATANWEGTVGPNVVIQASSKPFGGQWQRIPDDISPIDSFENQIAYDGKGNVTAIWLKFINGQFKIVQASQKFTISPIDQVLPPENLKGRQKIEKHFCQKDYVNIITWDPPSEGIPPVTYNVFRGSSLIGTVPAKEKNKFTDPHRQKCKVYTYFIVSIDEDGETSIPASIQIR